MPVSTIAFSEDKLAVQGLSLTNMIHYQLSPGALVQDTLRRKEGVLNDSGALVIRTGEFTGRSPKDKFTVIDEETAVSIDWNKFNIPISVQHFESIRQHVEAYLNSCEELWVRDCYVCTDDRYRLNIRVVNETPSMNLFAHNMFLRPRMTETTSFKPDWTILSAPGLRLNAAACGTRQHNAAVISFKHKIVLLAGSGYTGEIKKSIFTVLNYLLPKEHGVLSMHCSANMGERGDTALFFGLSGTGKTTLSADPNRRLIGDDEHGWSDRGIFNCEGGCYAKTIDLTAEREPEIFAAIRPGALVENVDFVADSNMIDFASRRITENTRVSYPLDFIANAARPSTGGIPANIFFLTCDATGVLPPISKLNPAQAMYQFISGYTAKVAGTETGITEPVATFSACFGAPFLPLHPSIYASMLGEKIRRHNVKVWLVNTGWTGGGYGVGTRISLKHTRALITAALSGALDGVQYDEHPVFRIAVPGAAPGVPSEILYPRDTWADKEAYDHAAGLLARKFIDNFSQFAALPNDEIVAAGPRVSNC